MNKHNRELGMVNPLLIASIILGIIAVALGGGFMWAYMNYVDQRDNVTAKVEEAVTAAKAEQVTADEAKFVEREKQPYNQLVGPSDLGSVTISYPKTWSVYVAKTDSSGYEAYLNPVSVPPISTSQPFATRVVIENKVYEKEVSSYNSLVTKGKLKSSPISINGFDGVRLDGEFSATRTGSMVIFKVRDKTLMVATDANSFKSDFDNIVIKSLDFNP